MAMSVTYTTFCGQIVHENRGGTERYYAPDTLGSTAALTDTAGNVTDTFEYWPYGEVRTRTGTTVTPFQFVGTLGYYVDAAARLYVRARYLLANYARWLTVDLLWPREKEYSYVDCKAHLLMDPSGLAGGWDGVKPPSLVPYNCVQLDLSIPLPSLGPNTKLGLSPRICLDSYNTCGCKQPVASSCKSIGLAASLDLKIVPGSGDFKSIEEDAKNILRLILNLSGGLTGAAYKKKECKSPGPSLKYSLCARVCAIFAYTDCCLKGENLSSAYFECKTTVGNWCGEPRLQFRATFDYQVCS